jgi:methylphosphotriester-DNA--protein-cysteine methyltransferase
MDKKIITVDKEKTEKPLVERVNDSLAALTQPGQKKITLEDIASQLGIDPPTLNRWLYFDDQFRIELEKYEQSDKSVLLNEILANRFDAVTLLMLLSNTKRRKHK